MRQAKSETQKKNLNYHLHLELNVKTKLVFSVRFGNRDVAILLYEDKNRPGELFRDFSFLYPNYYASEQEWDDDRNLIKSTIFVFDREVTNQTEVSDKLFEIAENMIEEKPNVNPCIEFVYDERLIEKFKTRNEDPIDFLNYILSLCENKEHITLSKIDLGHLSQ